MHEKPVHTVTTKKHNIVSSAINVLHIIMFRFFPLLC